MEKRFKEITQPREIYYNPMQLKVATISAQTTVIVGGRAIGKTTGIHAPRTASCLIKMPESQNGFISRTYKQFKTRIMGSLVGGWKDLGLVEDRDFTIGKCNKNFPKPKYSIGDYHNAIHIKTGAVLVLISQDRPGDMNGGNIQSLHADEAFQLNKQDLDENVLPALERGIQTQKHLPEWGTITLTTSMPLTPDGFWIFDYEKATDPELNKYIMQVYGVWYKLYMTILNNPELAPKTIEVYKYQMRELEEILAEFRKDYTLYIEADSFENFHALGEKYFRTQRRVLSDEAFNTQILNLRPSGIPKSQRFYAMLRPTHFYTDYDYSYLDKFIYLPEDKDTCRGDADCDRNEPLYISVDFGGRINSMVVCQEKSRMDSFNVLKELFALQEDDEFIDHLAAKFVRYYEPMTNRRVNMYYDVNGNKRVANSNETYAELIQRLLGIKGFNVQLMSYGNNPFHDDKYEFLNISLSELDRRTPKIRINEANCPDLKIALYNAPIKMVEGKKKKNKSSESMGSSTKQTQATHITDAFDYVYFSLYRDNMEEQLSNPIMMF
jgi:hypothetical protein